MNKRYVGLDKLKGICILIVVVCHTIHFEMIYPELFSKWIQIIFLNDFFFVAGWVYASRNIKSKNLTIKDQIMDKSLQLGIPYFLLGVITIIYNIVMVFVFENNYISDIYSGTDIILRDIFGFISLNGIGTLWFLPVLFIASTTIILLNKIFEDVKSMNMSIVAISVAAYIGYVILMKIIIVNNSIWMSLIQKEIEFLQRVLISICYINVGFVSFHFVSKYFKEGLQYIFLGLLLLLIWISASIFNVNLDFLAVIATPILFMGVEFIFKGKLKLRFLEYIGKNSLYIMILHYNIWLPVILQVANSFQKFHEINILHQRLIIFFVDFIISILSMEIIKKSDFLSLLFANGKLFDDLKRNLKYRRRT